MRLAVLADIHATMPQRAGGRPPAATIGLPRRLAAMLTRNEMCRRVVEVYA